MIKAIFIFLLGLFFFAPKTFAAEPTPLFYTKLDALTSLTSPTNGTGVGAEVKTTPTNDFVTGKNGKGLRLDTNGEYAYVNQVVGQTKNVKLAKGTIDFWYKPNFAPTDGLKHEILRIGLENQPGSIALIKRNGALNNDLYLTIRDANGTQKDLFSAIPGYNWTANAWINIRLTWDSTVGTNTQNSHIYINGTEIAYKTFSKGPFAMPGENPAQKIFIGSGSTNSSVASGIIDEFKIFDQPLVSASLSPTPTPVSTKPNIVLIYTDDQRSGTMNLMPNMLSKLESESVRFQNAFSTTPTCCPSRATLLTGLYSHNHGVFENETEQDQSGNPIPPYTGGVLAFHPESTLPIWLKNVGYRTGIFGKYLNGFGCLTSTIPPGWDDWNVFSSCQRDQYYGYSMNSNGLVQSYGQSPNDYSGRVITQKALSFIDKTPTNQPFFLYFPIYGPHEPSKPDPFDANIYPDMTLNTKPSFNEADISDKPSWVQALPVLDQTMIDKATERNRNIARTITSNDRYIGQIVDKLSQTGRLSNTAVIFMSDNGLSLGEHRWFAHDCNDPGKPDNSCEYGAKECVYEECVKVPLWVRLPEKISRQEQKLVGNIDLAPTILDLAGTNPTMLPLGKPLDGRSLVPLIKNTNISWRNEILLEKKKSDLKNLDFSAIRTNQYVYAEYGDDENTGNSVPDRELYDLSIDPYELNNLCPANLNYTCPGYEEIKTDLKTRLDTLR